MTKNLTLGRNERLKSRKAIELLFKEGRHFAISPFRIMYMNSVTTGLQFGVGVSVKNFKKAVDRNKIKRLTREAWRLQKKVLQVKLEEKKWGLHLFFIYTGRELPVYSLVYEKVNVILNKLMGLIDENPAPDS